MNAAPSRGPDPFVIGEATSFAEEASPSLRDETIDGLLSLRGHLADAVPSRSDPTETAILWPLQKLPSFEQHLRDLDSATDAMDRLAVRHAMSSAKIAELRQFLLDDAYAWGYLICRHRDMRPEVHMAMCYAAAGQAGKLAWYLTASGFEGYVPNKFREACRARSIDLHSVDGIYALDRALDWQDQRWPRGVFKSSAITHAGVTHEAARDPNSTNKITAAIDEKAFEVVTQAGDTFQSGAYLDFFPDRSATEATMRKVTLAGRTISHRQTTIQGLGYNSKEVGGHYDRFWTDDLVVRGPKGNATPAGMESAKIWLAGMQGATMIRPPSGRVRRIHVGTINDLELDDHAWLRQGAREAQCFSVVIPVETYATPPVSVMERGEPTMPTFFDAERITDAQVKVVTDESDRDGVEQWLSDYWLNPAASGSILFDDAISNDPERSWLGPFAHPKASGRKPDPDFTSRFLVGRMKRNDNGLPILKPETQKPQLVTFDPWSPEMDRVITLFASWLNGGQRWAATVAFVDPDLVKYQIETRTGDDGIDGWSRAISELAAKYDPRKIGIEKKCFADPVVQNLMRTDIRLRALRTRCVPVDQSESIEESRFRAAVSGPLKLYRWMLLPTNEKGPRDFGAAATRREMAKYRPEMKQPWPILENLAMVESIAVRPLSSEQVAKTKTARKIATHRYRQSINPVTGVPSAA